MSATMKKSEILELLDGLEGRLVRHENLTTTDIENEIKLLKLVIELGD